MQFRYVLFLSAIALMLVVAYAATEQIILETEEPTRPLVREKRGLLLAKKALLVGGGAVLASKALLGAGLIGAGIYKAKKTYGGYHIGYDYSGGYGNGGYHGYGTDGWTSGGGGYYYRPSRYYSSGWYGSPTW